MLTFLARRILLMIPTILGISFVTLMLIHLSPGDPVQAQMGGLQMGKGGLSPEEIEAKRRTFYLHLPLLVNFTPEDAGTVNANLLDDVTSPDELKRDRSIRRVSQRGGIILPDAVELLETVEGKGREALLNGLDALAGRLGVQDALAEAADPATFWKHLVETNQTSFTEEGAHALVSRYAFTNDSEALNALHIADSAALPAVFDLLWDVPTAGDEASRLMGFASHVTNTDITLMANDSPEAIDRAYDAWARWWKTRRSDYVDFSGGKRAASIITETQYAKWITRIFTLDFGISSRDNLPVRDKLWDRLQRTLILALLSLTVSYLLAVPLGVYSAVRQYSIADQVLSVLLFILYSLPSFWVAMLLQTYLCGGEGFDIFPLTGMVSENWSELGFFAKIADSAWHLALPVFCLTYASLASLSRYQRVGMLDTIRADYIRTARAKGLSEQVVILKHAMRNSVIPIVTLMGLQLPFLVSGAVIVEMIFQINGMGLETLTAIRTLDINWIMASVTLTAVMTMFGLLFSDVIYALIDPRIQVGNKS